MARRGKERTLIETSTELKWSNFQTTNNQKGGERPGQTCYLHKNLRLESEKIGKTLFLPRGGGQSRDLGDSVNERIIRLHSTKKASRSKLVVLRSGRQRPVEGLSNRRGTPQKKKGGRADKKPFGGRVRLGMVQKPGSTAIAFIKREKGEPSAGTRRAVSGSKA